MIIDHLLEFTSHAGQVLTAAAASDYRIDFCQKAPTTGLDYDRIVALFTVKADVTGKLQIKLQDCDTETGGYSDLAIAPELSSPTAGTQVVIPIPAHHKRYVQAYFGSDSTGITAGTVHGAIVSGVQNNVPPEQAASISDALSDS